MTHVTRILSEESRDQIVFCLNLYYNQPMKTIKDVLFLANHPVDTLKAIVLRAETRVFDEFAPTNYLGITLVEATKAVAKNRSIADSNGVSLKEWPLTARKQMLNGEEIRPDGRRPEHPNI